MNEFFTRTLTACALLLFGATIFSACPGWATSFLIIFLGLTLLYEAAVLVPRHTAPGLHYAVQAYIFASCFLLLHLNKSPDRILLVFIMLIAATHDIGAYCTGKLLGKHKIAPTISPGKTWEGFLGGCTATIALLCGIKYTGHFHFSYIVVVMWALVLSSVATLGDFFESWLKRRAGKKDSGHWLPGHGGLFDRFDSLVAITPVVYMLKKLFF